MTKLAASQLDAFGIVHHRALNSREKMLDALEAQRALPRYTHLVEGDICWRVDGDDVTLYFYHPDLIVDILNADALASGIAAGEIWTLDDALDAQFDSLRFIVELKRGQGDIQRALAALIAKLEARRSGRYWIDTFSIRDLRITKDQAPDRVTCSLHTKLVTHGCVLKTAAEFPPLSLRRHVSLDHIDLLTYSYKSSWQYLLRRDSRAIPSLCTALARHGKSLVFGGVDTLAQFRQVEQTAALAGYIKFDWRELLA